MSYPFQVAALVSSPLYPNSISWSEENLIAVATDNNVAILNPEQPHSPRGIITPTPGKVLSVGTIDRKDLLSGCLLPTCLSRDQRPCVRSISWSPVGFAPNSGCLLAVCTTEGRVKIYRLPYCEFQAEWAEAIDVTEMFHGYLVKTNYGEPDVPSSIISDDSAIRSCTETYSADKATSSSTRQCKRKRDKDLLLGNQLSNPESVEDANAAPSCAKCMTTVILETALFPSSIVQEGTSVEVFKLDGRQHVWIVGRLESLDGSKALILFPERDANGKQEWFEMDPGLENFYQSHGLDIDNGNNFPKIRPSMNAGNLPRELFLSDCHIVSEILKVGQAVEAWTNDRWVEGFFAGFHDGGFRFRALGDDDAMTLDASFVRLAPSWVKDEKLWKVTLVRVHIKDKNFSEVIETRFDNMKENYLLQIAPAPKVKMKHSKRTLQNYSLQLITACQYAARSALLASLAVAWSPELQLSQANPNNSCNCFCLLAVGAKSGKVSVWRIHKPEHYSVEHASGPTKMMLVGVFQVHNAWVTALGWEILASDGSNPQLLLATGSSDGSVKIWLGYGADLQRLTEANPAPFSLLMEVAPVHPVPVSVLSLTVPLQFQHKVLLAIGKGSGSFEICTYDIRMKNLKKVGSFDVHDYAVTGLAWAFEGCCLYSCSKDNSLRCWIFYKGSFSEVPIPPNNLGIRVRSPTDLPCVYDSCFGVAVSPGNLAIALVRSFDPGC
ncbi:hypothetical protein Nepgr_031502 [Nepenthes gracilis]|uniref:Transcription factor IIIC 90kDa subunit N-terminal domain-containing protein n=1 Tax=Nepenthes gracilis TaxID=150966 RepID=A0AAD3TIF0_NEPGR|nr:hypothetical protein Nepgr_031502 [Nepenthes gracilis]